MEWKTFWLILGGGIFLVFIQGWLAWIDGFLTQSQMRSNGITNGYALLEHGGMWADVFIISPLVAFALSRYRLQYFSKWGLLILAVAVAFSLVMGRMYRDNGIFTPEAHTHDGWTTPAGWVHGLFAVAVIWVCCLVYFNLANPSVPRKDLLIFSTLLTPFFFFGIAKFNSRWHFDSFAKWQTAISIFIIWGVTVWRLFR